MSVQDGYYFIFNFPVKGTWSLVCDAGSGRVKIQMSATRADFLKTSSNMVFRVESVGSNAYLIYNETYQLALALQASGGLTITLQPLSKNDQKQWWILQKDNSHLALTTYIQKGPAIALEGSSTNDSIVDGAYHSFGSVRQQWAFFQISDIPDSSSNDEDDVKENRAWLREMLKYYTSNISQVYYAIGTYPYERSHITNPNAALRKAIAWQNGGSSS